MPHPRSVRNWLLLAIVLGPALYAFVYFRAANGEAFRFAREWVLQCAALRSTVGEISSVRLDPWRGYSDRFAGDRRQVHLVVDVTGTQQSVNVKLELEKRGGDGWRVLRSGTVE